MNVLKSVLDRFKDGGLTEVATSVLIHLSNQNWILKKMSCSISQDLPETVRLPHPVGIVIHANANIGENVSIYQNVTIGIKRGKSEVPEIKDNVTLYSGSVVVGDVTIGENSLIGANSVVLDDIPPNSIAAGVPARVVAENNIRQ